MQAHESPTTSLHRTAAVSLHGYSAPSAVRKAGHSNLTDLALFTLDKRSLKLMLFHFLNETPGFYSSSVIFAINEKHNFYKMNKVGVLRCITIGFKQKYGHKWSRSADVNLRLTYAGAWSHDHGEAMLRKQNFDVPKLRATTKYSVFMCFRTHVYRVYHQVYRSCDASRAVVQILRLAKCLFWRKLWRKVNRSAKKSVKMFSFRSVEIGRYSLLHSQVFDSIVRHQLSMSLVSWYRSFAVCVRANSYGSFVFTVNIRRRVNRLIV